MSPVIWMLGIGFSIAAMIVTAAMSLPFIHLAITAVVSILVALAAFQETRALPSRRRVDVALHASSSFRHMGLVWTWAAVALLATYSFILQWREWWQFFFGFFILAGLCLFMSATLRKDAEAAEDDDNMFSLARGLSLVLMIATVLAMIGLVVHDGRQFTLGGKLLAFMPRPGQRAVGGEWAANNIFFFGAMAIAAISFNSYRALRNV